MSEMNLNASRLPWRITSADERKGREIVDVHGATVAKLTLLDMDNAELIVSSVNASRTAPVSAPLDTQALPPPIGQIRTDIERTNAIWIGPLPPHGTNLHTADQMRAVIAPYAERIRHLERELAERKPASIDAQKEAWDAAVATVRANSEKSDAAGFVKVLMTQMLDSIDKFAQTTFAAAPTPINSGMEEAKP